MNNAAMTSIAVLLYVGIGVLVARSLHDPEEGVPEDIPPWVYWYTLISSWPASLYMNWKDK